MASVVTVSEPPCINPFQTVAPRLWRENGGKSTRTRHVIVRVVATPTQPFTFDRILPLLQAEKDKSSTAPLYRTLAELELFGFIRLAIRLPDEQCYPFMNQNEIGKTIKSTMVVDGPCGRRHYLPADRFLITTDRLSPAGFEAHKCDRSIAAKCVPRGAQ